MYQNDKILSIVATLSLALLAAACNKNYQITTSGGSSQGTQSTGSPPGGGVQNTIQTFTPALAVRDISCLACHANVQANVITDFGYSSSWYLNGDQSFGNSHYMANTWQSIQSINGQVFIPPSAPVPSADVSAAGLSGTMDLLAYLTNPNVSNMSGSWLAAYWNESTPSSIALDHSVTPPASTSPVVEQSGIYIGAPTAAQILAIVTAPQSNAPWVQTVGQSFSGLSGLGVVNGSATPYISNVNANGNGLGAIQCSGKDVVINGTLLLYNAQIYAENGGCRLYVTGSVFIEGPITYLQSGANADPTQNLQITSATSIIMGVGISGSVWDGGSSEHSGSVASNQYSTTPLSNRLLGDVRGNMLLRGATTSSAYSAYANSILSEGQNIGATLLQDAANPGSLPTAQSAAGQLRASINFQHLLLNAPLIHSRYLGTTQGVIVAESAEFSLGAFAFEYDPVFAAVAVLPALPYDILCTSTTNCKPTQP